MSKEALRKKLLKIRRKNYKDSLIKIKNIKSVILKNKINNIGGYYPVNFEVDCLNLLKLFEKQNYKISLPRVGKNNVMNFYNYSSNDPLYINKYGIPEPKKNKIVYPDILLVPLVGFDKRLFRIGYGGGYYDRYLKRIKKIKKCISIGLAFPFQLISLI